MGPNFSKENKVTAQELREELICREAYALGYRNGATDTILSITQKLQQKEKEEKNGTSKSSSTATDVSQTN